MKRSAAMFARAAGTNVVPDVKSKDNVCKDKMFQGEEFMSSLLNTTEQNKTKQTGSMLQPILMCGWRYVQNWKSLL